MRLVMVCMVLVLTMAGTWGAPPERAYPAEGSYVVVTSDGTWKMPEWRKAVEVLRKKYDADLIVCEKSVLDARAALARIAPNYACFVLRPEEAGRQTIVGLHRMTRGLDDDPYTDVVWAVLTGYEAGDALRIAKHSEPLVVDSAASSMGPGLFKNLKSGFASSETKPHEFWIKKPGGETEKKDVKPDPIISMVRAFNTMGVDCFQTSGHATEQDWQVGYGVRAGQFRCRDGQLFGVTTDRKGYAIHAKGPTVYMPMGNCLIGHISKRDCMATAWLHSGGAYQMFGYTAVTFHGYMGWGIGKFFSEGPYTLSESFYFNNQALVHELETKFPKKAKVNFDNFDHRGAGLMASRHGIKDRTLLGHLWDRDIVAFYGDPAWAAVWPDGDKAFTWTVERKAESFEVTVRVLQDGKWGRPPLVPLKERVAQVANIECSLQVEPMIADNFLLIPVAGQARKQGDVITLTFEARVMERNRTSASST